MANGIIIVDKPADWTSHGRRREAAGRLGNARWATVARWIPLATGVLPIFVGQATQASFAESAKGISGRPASACHRHPGRHRHLRAAPVRWCRTAAVGTVLPISPENFQAAPMYSAIKIGGKLYELARQEAVVVRRGLSPFALGCWAVRGPDWRLRVVCSQGDIYRTLCRDIGRRWAAAAAWPPCGRTMATGFTVRRRDWSRCGRRRGLLRPVDSCSESSAYVLPTPWAVACCRSGKSVSNVEPLPESTGSTTGRAIFCA